MVKTIINKGKVTIITTVAVVIIMALSMLFVPVNSGGISGLYYSPQVSGNNASSNTFYIAVDSYGSFTPNLNPFSPVALQPYGYSSLSLVFSPLMYLMNGQSPEPGVATSYSYASNLTSVTFHLRSDVEYNNGQPFNASDVLYSFTYIMQHPAIDSQGLDKFVKSIAVIGNSVTFNLNNTAYTDLYSIMSQPMLYPAQWENITDPQSAVLTNPIGTGPFIVSSVSSTGFTFTWNSHYYYTGSHLQTVILQSYPTVSAEANALDAGTINWLSGAFDAQAPSWASQNSSHFYFAPPSGFLMLQLNNNIWPLNNSYFRAAIANVFNRTALSTESLQPPAQNFVIPALNNYLTPSFLQKYPNGAVYTKNLTLASNLMEKAGYHLSNGKWLASNGSQPTITLSGNGAAANVVANLNHMVTELTSFGIKANTYLPSGAIFYSNLYQGNYSAGLGFLASSINPIGALNVSFSNYWNVPIGKTAIGDYSRFDNASFTQNITLAAQKISLSEQQPYIMNALNILVNQTPAIPIAESVSQNEFNTFGFSGVNQTLFNNSLYSNSFGPVVSIAVPLVGVHFNSNKAITSPISTTDYAIIGVIVVAAVVIGVGLGIRRRGKKED
jgi:peptide/nickel transport system substrate-binding protein